MILEELVVDNFRQYYGRQVFNLSPVGERTLIVIRGPNGSGKSTFLNALSWCLYGRREFDLPYPEHLLNERVARTLPDRGQALVSVSLTFTERHRRYTATRTQLFLKIRDDIAEPVGDDEMELDFIDEDGLHHLERDAPQAAVEQILPPRLRRYFFFDGEQIDSLAKEERSGDVVEAIRSVMGLELVERGLHHLQEARREFQTELKKIGDTETQRLVEQEQGLEDEIERGQADLDQLRRNVAARRQEMHDVDDRLRNLDKARELQERRDKIELRLTNIRREMADDKTTLRALLSRDSWLAFVPDFAPSAQDILEQSRLKGHVPSVIKDQFVEDLLARGVCICGRPLEKGADPYMKVAEWRNQAGNAILEQSATMCAGALRGFQQDRSRLRADLEGLAGRRERLTTERDSLLDQLEEITTLLRGQDAKEIVDLEQKRRETERAMLDDQGRSGRLSERLERAQKDRDEVRRKISQMSQKAEGARLAQRRIDICDKTAGLLEAVFEASKTFVREQTERKVNSLLQSFLRKDFYVVLSEDYTLRLFKKTDKSALPAAMSQGERQVVSLSFIGGLVAIAGERAKQAGLLRGGVYPMVIDSPFGVLDDVYSQNIAHGLPELAPQMVMLVSAKQWSADVALQVQGRVARMYDLKNVTDPEYTMAEEVSNLAQ